MADKERFQRLKDIHLECFLKFSSSKKSFTWQINIFKDMTCISSLCTLGVGDRTYYLQNNSKYI